MTMHIRTADENRIVSGGIDTRYLSAGTGHPVILLHGSGPGVTARSNWEGTIADLSGSFHVLAPEMVGYGATERPRDVVYGVPTWVRHSMDFIDAFGFSTFDLVGNSMGGLVSLHIAQMYPGRLRRLVLMGTPSPAFVPTEGLRALRSYEPTLENMRRLLVDYFAYDSSIVTDDMVQARYEASNGPLAHETYKAMFQDPRHAGNTLNLTEDGVAAIHARTLIVHGREDKVIPVSCAWKLNELISDSELHVFSNVGHWTQIERRRRFAQIVQDFLSAPD